MNDRPNDIEHAAEGTCKWLPEHGTYKHWAACPRGLLWIKGKPGSGKSTLLRYALSKVAAIPNFQEGALVLSFFFHGRGAELQRTPLGFFRSLLHQLLPQVPDALPDLVETFRRRLKEIGKPKEGWEWHQNELWDFFESSLPVILQTRPLWLFVDALDESGDEHARDLVWRMKSLLRRLPPTRLPFRICFSCRHYPILDEDCQFISPEEENGDDISTYVRARLSASKRLRASAIPELITGNANGVFMWARLVVDQALRLDSDGVGLAKIEHKVNSIPKELHDLYCGLVQDMHGTLASRKLILWVCFATRPLSLDELRWAVAVDADCPHQSLHECELAEDLAPDNDTMEARVTALSRGLVETVSSFGTHRVAQFIHQSVQDFFFNLTDLALLTNNPKSAEPKVSPIDLIGTAHCQLFRTCTHYLAMAEIGQWQTSKSDRRALTSRFPLLHYATTSWISHASKSEERGIFQDDLGCWPSEALMQLWGQIYPFVQPSMYLPAALRGSGKTKLIHVASRYQ